MVVGWVGTATDARCIESLVSIAHSRWPLHCMNEPATGGEGMASGDNSASVQMCPGSRSSLLGQQKEGSQPQAARQAQEAGKEKTIRKNKKGHSW